MSFLIASQITLWIGLLTLGVVCIALARQIGVLHQRIAPAGALSLPQPLKPGDLTPEMQLSALDGSTVKIGGVRGGRSQLLLFLLLIPRFWQRGVAVTYYLQNMVEPIPVQLFTPAPVVAQVVVVEPAALPVIPGAPPEPQAL